MQSSIITTTALMCSIIVGCSTDNDKLSGVEQDAVPPQEFGKRDWDKHPPTTEFEELAYHYERFQRSRYRAVLKNELYLYDDEGRIVGYLKPGLIVHSSSMDDVEDTDLYDNKRRKILFDMPTGAVVERLMSIDSARFGMMWFRNDAVIAPINNNGEQGGTGQPATRPESKSEDGDKPQPEAEGRSR